MADVRLVIGADVAPSVDQLKKDLKKIFEQVNSGDGEKIKIKIDNDALSGIKKSIDDIGASLRNALSGAGTKNDVSKVFSGMESSAADTVSVVKELAAALKDFNGVTFNFNASSNPFQRNAAYGIAAREGIAEMLLQVEALEEEFRKASNAADGMQAALNAIKDTKVFNSNTIEAMQLSRDPNAKLGARMVAIKEYISQLKQAAKIQGIDISQATSGFDKSADQIVNNVQKISSGEAEIEHASQGMAQALRDAFGSMGSSVDGANVEEKVNLIAESLTNLKFDSSSFDRLTESIDRLTQLLSSFTNEAGGATAAFNNLNLGNIAGQMDSVVHSLSEGSAELGNLTQASATLNVAENQLSAVTGKYKNDTDGLTTSLEIRRDKNNELQLSQIKLNQSIKQSADATRQSMEADREKANEEARKINLIKQESSLQGQIADHLRRSTAAEYSSNEQSRIARENLKDYSYQLKELRTRLEAGKIGSTEFAEGLNKIRIGVRDSVNDMKTAGDYTLSWSDRLTNLGKKFTLWLSASSAVMFVVRSLKQMVTASIELEDSMTQLRIVTNETDQTYSEFGSNIAKTAQEIGASVTDLIDATTTYARLGYSLDESSVLSKLTGQLQMVGDIETEDAQNAITAIIKAYDVGVDDMELVMDKLVAVGNNFPISVSQIAEGMNNASSALAAAGNSFEESIALLTAANTTIQNASRSSTGLRTIVARIRNVKTELEELGEEVLTEAKYEELVNALTSKGVQITDEFGQFRSTYQIISDIAQVWKDMQSSEQAALAQTLAGTRQQAVFYSLIEQFSEASGAMDKMADSAGTLSQSYDIYMESTTAHINAFKSALAGLSSDVMQSDFLKFFIDLGTHVINIADRIMNVINALGGLKTVLVAVAGVVAVIKIQTITAGLLKLAPVINNVTSLIVGIPLALLRLTTGAGVAASGMTRLQYTFNALGVTTTALQAKIAALTIVITAIIAIYSAWKRSHDEMLQSAQDASRTFDEHTSSMEENIARAKELRATLDSGTASEEDSKRAKEELISIQESLVDSYGKQADGIDLVNGKLDEEIEKLHALSEADSDRFLTENYKAISEAERELSRERTVYLGKITDVTAEDYLALKKLFSEYNGFSTELRNNGAFSELTFTGTPEEFDRVLHEVGAKVRDLAAELGETPLLKTVLGATDDALADAQKTIDTYRGIFDTAQKAKFATDPRLYGGNTAVEWVDELTDAVNNYNTALESGDSSSIIEAGNALQILKDNATAALTGNDGVVKYSWAIDEVLEKVASFPKRVREVSGELKDNKISFSSLLVDEEGGKTDFATGIDEYIKNVEKLKGVIEEIHKGDFDVNGKEFAELVMEFPELMGHTNDLEDAIKSLMNTMRGSEGIPKSLVEAYDDYVEGIKKVKELGFSPDETVFGNIDLAQRVAIQWTDELIKTYEEQLASWGYGADDVKDAISTVIGGSGEYAGIEIAFSPILQTEDGGAKLLSRETVDKYIFGLIDEARSKYGEWTDEDLFRLDADGLEIDGEKINGLLAGIGANARKVGEVMHFLGKNGDLDLAREKITRLASEAGLSIEELNEIIAENGGLISDSTGLVALFQEQFGKLNTEEDVAQLEAWYRAILSLTDDNILETTKADITSFVTSLNSITDILGKQTTASVIDPEDFANLKDYSSALEYHNGVLQYNSELVDDIIKSKAKEKKAFISASKAIDQSKYYSNAKEIERLRKQLVYLGDSKEDEKKAIQQSINSLLSQNNTLANNCKQYNLMTDSIDRATSAYQHWLNAQNAAESGEMFDGALAALEKINNTLNVPDSEDYGRIGNESYKASLEFVLPESIDRSNEAQINAYIASIGKYFTYDEDGKRDGMNIRQFCEDAVDAGLMVLDESGNRWEVAGGVLMSDFAKGIEEGGLGLALPVIQAMFGEMEEFGGEFSWTDEVEKSLGDLAIEANEAREALREVEGLGDVRLTLNVQDYEDKNTAIQILKNDIEYLQNAKVKFDPKVDAEDIENANTVIEYCVRQIQELERPYVMSVDASQVPDELGTAIELFQNFNESYNQIEVDRTLGLDTTEAEEELEVILSKISEIAESNPEIAAAIDTSSVESFNESLKSLTPEVLVEMGVNSDLVDDYEAEDQDATVSYEIDTHEPDRYKPDDKWAWVKYLVNDVNIRNWQPSSKTVTVTPTLGYVSSTMARILGIGGASGTANAGGSFGISNAGGNWGTAVGGRTLVGELGREIVVDPHTGKWYTVGDSGAEFVNIPKNAIIFNHKQTESLLKYGSIFGRGQSMVQGTAMVTGGINVRDADRSSSNKSTYNQVYDAVYNATTDAYSSSSGVGSGSEGKTAFELFKDWFSTLFDWIEVKLEHQTDKISRYIKKAENAIEAGNYSSASSYYVNAIDSTSTLIEQNEKGAQAYLNRANEVLQRAYRAGTINAPGIETIKYLAREGAYDYSDYNEEINEVIRNYKEMYDKAMACSNAVDELHSNMQQYVSDLKKLRDTQRDARTDLIDQRLSIANSFVEVSTGNAGYNAMTRYKLGYRDSQLSEINSAYLAAADGMSSDVKSLGSSATSRINSQYSSTKVTAYRTALNNAKNAISKQVPVSSSDLSVIAKYSSPTYESILAYNQGVSMLETARMEYAVEYAANTAELYSNVAEIYNAYDDATNNTISLLQQKAGNTSYSAATKNSNLQKIASYYNEILSNDQAEISYFQNNINNNASTINSSAFKGASYGALSAAGQKSVNGEITNARDAVKKDSLISMANLQNIATYVSKGYISPSFYAACVAYNNAWNSRQQARWQNEIDQQTIANEKAALAAQMVSNYEQDYNNQLKSLEASTTTIKTAQNLKTTRGAILDKSDYQNLINQSKKEQSIYEAEAKAIKGVIDSALSSGLWSTASQEYKDAMLSYQGYVNSAKECAIAQQEWNNSITNLPIERIKKQLSLLDAQMDVYESIQSYHEAKWIDATEEDYEKMLTNVNKRVDQLKEERDILYANYVAARDSKEGGSAFGGKDYIEWAELYDNSLTSLNNAYKEIEDIKDALRDDVYWRTFDRAHESAKRFKSILSDMRDLIDESMLVDSNGKLTEYGVANIANIVKQYELAREEVQNYSNDIANLNSLYADGWYEEREYMEKLDELKDSLLKAASDVKSVTDNMTDMYKSMAQSELDALYKLIDARSEALDKKKEYYEYDKTIKEKTKDVMALQAQLAAIEGIRTAEAKAKKAQLQADLAKAQSELDETVNGHIYDLSKEALANLKTTLQDAFNDKWDNLNQNLEDIVNLISAANTLAESSSRATYATLTKLLSFYGVDPVATGIDQHFASGTTGAPRKLRALVGEDGSEIITTESGLILTLNKGDGVIPAKMTKNLMAMATGNLAMPDMGSIKLGNTTINQHYDSLINIEGSADAATVEDLKKFSKDILEQSYNYTSQKMYNGYIKAGGKRVV